MIRRREAILCMHVPFGEEKDDLLILLFKVLATSFFFLSCDERWKCLTQEKIGYPNLP
jgi:hypothetical protein